MLIPAGLYYVHPSYQRRTALPLSAASVAATIADGCARVALTQTFSNVTTASLEATYLLPMDEGAAVVSFEANCNGRIVTARVEESGAAKAEYDAALARGDGAYLLDSVSSEHFTIAVGNIPSGAEVTITTTYVANLRTRGDVYSFVVPNRLAPKYGASLAPEAKHLDATVPLDLVVQWTMSPGLAEMDSPSHPDVVDSVVVSDDGAGASISVSLASLETDFVLNAVAVTPPGPILLVENRSLPSGVTTQAAMVSFTPQLEVPDQRTELVFVIDRSGSMGGSKIEHARKALQLFLRSLPEDCYFNIIGFGSRTDFCFDLGAAVPYNDQTLARATAHIAGMGANLGGTELLAPLKAVFASPTRPGFSRQVFVLTDGQVSNTNTVIQAVASALKAATSPTRVFTLGLGNGASRALVNGMARAGNGTAFFIDDDAAAVLTATVVRQLKQALQPQITGLTLEWTSTDGSVARTNVARPPHLTASKAAPPATTRKVLRIAPKANPADSAGAASSVSAPSTSAPASAVVQAPYSAPALFNGERFVAFAFFKPSFGTPARLRLYDASGEIDFAVSLETLQAVEGETVHALAARALIRDLEEGSSYMHATAAGSAAISAEIVRLGTAFGLASTKTSFVAVEHRSDAERMQIVGHAGARAVLIAPRAPPAMRLQGRNRGRGGARKKMSRARRSGGGGMTGGFGGMPSPMPVFAMSCSAAPAPMAMCNSLSFDVDDDCDAMPMELAMENCLAAPAASAPAVDYQSIAVELAMLQSTKGMFGASALAHLPSGKTTKPSTAGAASESAWVTALVLAYFASPHFRAYYDEIELVISKARKWLASTLGDTSSANALIATAKSVLAA